MHRYLLFVGMLSVLALGACAPARVSSSIDADSYNALGGCSTRADFADTLGGPDRVMRLAGGGLIEIHEFSIRPEGAPSTGGATALSIATLGLWDATSAVAAPKGSPDHKTCDSREQISMGLACTFARGRYINHYAGEGQNEAPYCSEMKVLQMGAFDGFNDMSSCPRPYRELLAREIDTSEFPDAVGLEINSGFKTLVDWQAALSVIRKGNIKTSCRS